MGPYCPSDASSSWHIAHRLAEEERADTLSVGERRRRRRFLGAIGSERSESSNTARRTPAGQALDSDLLLIIDPKPNQTPEMGQEPLTLILWIGHVDRFSEHAVEVREIGEVVGDRDLRRPERHELRGLRHYLHQRRVEVGVICRKE